MSIQESENQLKLFDINSLSVSINAQNIVKYSHQSKRKARNLEAAIFRMREAKHHHEMMSKIAEENLFLKIENDKLRQELRLLKKAN